MAKDDITGADISGRYAIAGFLYQSLGAAALKAMIHEAPPKEGGFEVLLSAVKGGKLNYELFGQDVVLEGKQESGRKQRRIFVQFKYSLFPHKNSIGPAELTDIVDAFRKSRKFANGQKELKSNFVLVSNRGLSPGSKAMRKAACEGNQCKYLGGPNRKTHNRNVLKQLEMVLATGADLENSVDDFAAEFGVLSHEMEEKLEAIVGGLQRLSGGKQEIDQTWLVKRLTGSVRASEIGLNSLAEPICRGVRRFSTKSSVPEDLIRRDWQDRLADAVFAHPVVVLFGAGGRGKTVGICNQLVEWTSDDSPQRHIAASLAAELPQQWISDLVCRWRGNAAALRDSNDLTAVERLQRPAATARNPTLVLVVDGLDEIRHASADLTGRARDVIDFAMSTLDVTDGIPSFAVSVIISCRHETELTRVWRGLDDPGVSSYVEVINVSDFSPNELAQVALDSQPEDIYSSIVNSLRARDSSSPDGSRIRVDEQSGGMADQSVNPEILEALLHPSLWGCFARMNEQERLDALKGRAPALAVWTNEYIQRFIKKLHQRRPDLIGVEIATLLSRIAENVDADSSQAARYPDWETPACEGHDVQPSEASAIFREARSFGLVRQDDDSTWRWAHRFIHSQLKTAQPPKTMKQSCDNE